MNPKSPTSNAHFSAEVLFQAEVSYRAVGWLFVGGFALVFGLCAWLGVPTSHYGLVFLGGLGFSSVVVMLSLEQLKKRARRKAVVSFQSPVLTLPDHGAVDLTRQHEVGVQAFEGSLYLSISQPVLLTVALEGLSRTEAEAVFDAPWFIETVTYTPVAGLRLNANHLDFSHALLAEFGRNRMQNQAFKTWHAYPWEQPCEPKPLAQDATPESLSESLHWPDSAIGVSASYLFFQAEDGWRILPLGGGLKVSLEIDSSIMRVQGGVPVKYVYVVINSPEVQTRIRMEDSGSTQLGAESTDVRRAFVAFVNSRTNGRE